MDELGFIGAYKVTLDNRSRILIPAKYKKILDFKNIEKLILIPFPVCSDKNSFPTVSCYTIEEYKKAILNVSDEELNLYYMGIKRKIDKMGRVSIPNYIQDLFNVGDKLIAAGKVSYFNIWKKEDYKMFINELCKKYPRE